MNDLVVRLSSYKELLNIYQKQDLYFPLIGSVLEEKQDGLVLKLNPDLYLVIHSFGFSQFVGNNGDIAQIFSNFLNNRQYLSVANVPNKLRIYCPDISLETKNNVQLSCRIRMKISNCNIEVGESNEYEIIAIDRQNFDLVNDIFKVNLDARFWRNKDEFLAKSYGFVLKLKDSDEFCSICYACAISNDKAEIDIATLEKYRKKGFGKEVAKYFIKESLAKKISPSWDCYVNNQGSYNLAKNIGFVDQKEYNFYTAELLK